MKVDSKTIESLLSELKESLEAHGRTVKIYFMLYKLRNKAGYNDEEIAVVAQAMDDIVS